LGLDYSGRIWILPTSYTENDRLFTYSGYTADHTAIDVDSELEPYGAVEKIWECGGKTNKNTI
jgi:hypothetical protein